MSRDSLPLTSNLHGLFDFGVLGGLSDGELLDRICIHAAPDSRLAEAAFEVLVMRHGPMVHRVCRIHLREPSDVDDAFQATFLVFARRLGSIRRRESVASWLHGVASRVAAHARVEASRRSRVQIRSIGSDEHLPAPSSKPAEAAEQGETGRMVQEEVRRLPGRYREVLILCYWEGLTQEEAAVRLGCPLGTVRSRSARARDMLRSRLARRGLAPASAMAAAFMGENSAHALAVLPRLSAGLVHSTVRACVTISSGLSIRKVASGSILFLAENFLRSMTMLKIKMVVLSSAVIGLGFLGAGRGDSRKDEAEKKADPAIGKAESQAAKPVPTKQKKALPRLSREREMVVTPDYIVEPPDLILVEVLDALPGRPITGQRLVRPDGKVSLGFYGEVPVAGLTLPEIKEKIVLHLRKYMNDDTLGLEVDDESKTPTQVTKKINPRDTDRVYVDVAAWNSKYYYVQGDVAVPGRLPVTGNETVLDAINFAGGLLPSASPSKIRLVRPAPPGESREQTLAVDYKAILDGDPTTNYQVMNKDRLIVSRDPATRKDQPDDRPDRDNTKVLQGLEKRMHDLEGRLIDLDHKLDRVLEKLDGR